PLLVRALRVCWKAVAVRFVCTSANEAAQAHLPPERVALLPLPVPRSALARRAVTTDGGVDPAGPAAYVGRFDVHRKGIDRLAAWLQVAADSTAERPLLRLFAPAGDAPPPALAELIARGVVAWDTETSGADLAGPLRQCRALMLLSRY